MPQRFLRPGITGSKKWNRCDYQAQSFFIRLITLVDDHGRFEADPELLRSLAFPRGGPDGKMLSLENICLQLQALVSKDMVQVYQIDGKEYLQLLTWQEKPRSESRFPAPPCKQMLANENKCLLPSSSSSPSPSTATLALVADEPQPTSSKQPDDEWLDLLAKSKTYEGIDVKREYGKMVSWCSVNSKKPSRRRFINWLNRAEKPINAAYIKANPGGSDRNKGTHNEGREHAYANCYANKRPA